VWKGGCDGPDGPQPPASDHGDHGGEPSLENLTSRVKAYLKWKHPGLKTYWDTIAMFVADFPLVRLSRSTS
jgi:hypothetical protein